MAQSNVEQIIKSLSDPFRLKLLERIKSGPGETDSPSSRVNPSAVCPLDLKRTFPSMTKERLFYHLQLLAKASLIVKTKEGRYTYYSINPEGFHTAIDWFKKISE